jgi:hypothetical protein
MPFKDPQRILKSYLLRTDPKPTKILLGEDHQYVVILRTLMKFGALLAAGVAIATSIVLKDIPLICFNLLLATVILGLQIYKIVVDDEEKLRLTVELLLILGAAGVAAWLAYPLLISAPITYLTILIFANYVATVVNVASYVSGFFSPFIVSCLEWLMYTLAGKEKSNTSKFAIKKDTQLVLIENICVQYRLEETSKDGLVQALNKSIEWLDTKLKTVKSYFFSSEIYSDKISNFKKLIRQIRKGDLADLLNLLQRKRSSRIAKIQVIINIKNTAHRLFSSLTSERGSIQNSPELSITAINTFLKKYTRLSPISSNELNENKNESDGRQETLYSALKHADGYHREKLKFFDQLLQPYVTLNIVKKDSLPLLPAELEIKSN